MSHLDPDVAGHLHIRVFAVTEQFQHCKRTLSYELVLQTHRIS